MNHGNLENVLTGVQAVGLSLCPETPVWLEWKGKPEEASAAKDKLQGPDSSDNDAEKAEMGTGDESDVQQPLRGLPERRHSDAGSSYQVRRLHQIEQGAYIFHM